MHDSSPDIYALLPHRPPMLMLDRILSLEADGCSALKNISYAEPCFQGHFPGSPIFPGVLTLEALGQACSACLIHNSEENRLPIFAGAEYVHFRKPVFPGDQLYLSVKLQSVSNGFYSFETRAQKNGESVCTAVLTLTLR